ncbi:Gfo/Idh/MocA family protein [Microbacterium sp. NPDC056569]|uniref:Gfo/Idh/MocA family protein n=1 Tax=Microbacterium sp. NPDC056569 TaxID=3345867 RepID=UPI00366D396A
MSAPRPPFRVGIIGTGGIAHAHAEALTALAPRVAIAGVVDLDPARANAFAERFGVDRVYSDAAELFANETLDLVHVCTPPQTHTPLAIEAMRAGVPSLVEKPTALTLAEVDELAAVQAETGVPVLTVFQHRFGAAARHLQALVGGGELGRPLVATCETLWYRPDEYFDMPWRGRWDVEGGGPTMGHGIHQFDLLFAIFGEWSQVSAYAARQLRPTDTEDVSMAIVRFGNGALATVVNSLVSPHETSRLRFDFEYASVEVRHLYGYTSEDWTFTPAPGHEHLSARWAEGLDSGATSGHLDQVRAILDALEAGEAPGVDLAEARRTLEFAAATYASAFRGVAIDAGELVGDDPFVRSMSGGIVPWAAVKAVLA